MSADERPFEPGEVLIWTSNTLPTIEMTVTYLRLLEGSRHVVECLGEEYIASTGRLRRKSSHEQ